MKKKNVNKIILKFKIINKYKCYDQREEGGGEGPTVLSLEISKGIQKIIFKKKKKIVGKVIWVYLQFFGKRVGKVKNGNEIVINKLIKIK